MDWPTWSQTSYRSWSIGEPPDELPEIVVEVALRVQRLAEAPDTDMVLHALPGANPLLGVDPLVLTATTIEQVHADGGVRWAVEATYEGSVHFSERQLEDPGEIGPVIAGLTRWISSTLVQLADLPFSFLPPDENDG